MKINTLWKKHKVTLTMPSECPVTITFCVSHSFISDTQQHRICWLRPVKVLALAMGLPLMLQIWMWVPAQDTISPYLHTRTDRHTQSRHKFYCFCLLVLRWKILSCHFHYCLSPWLLSCLYIWVILSKISWCGVWLGWKIMVTTLQRYNLLFLCYGNIL